MCQTIIISPVFFIRRILPLFPEVLFSVGDGFGYKGFVALNIL